MPPALNPPRLAPSLTRPGGRQHLASPAVARMPSHLHDAGPYAGGRSCQVLEAMPFSEEEETHGQ